MCSDNNPLTEKRELQMILLNLTTFTEAEVRFISIVKEHVNISKEHANILKEEHRICHTVISPLRMKRLGVKCYDAGCCVMAIRTENE